jgi:ABC-type multidrug transport system fused ATPase/permease subunit
MNHMNKYSENYQKEKGNTGSMAQESIGNIRTVKAFADEQGSLARYQIGN